MKIYDTYSICRTGKLKAHFTLYIQRTISTETFYNDICYYVQNLAFDKDEAVAKTKALMANRLANTSHLDSYGQQMDFCNSKKRESIVISRSLGWNGRRVLKGLGSS